MTRKFLTLTLALLLGAVAGPALAQGYTFPLPGVTAAQAMTADDTNVALYCKYVGTGAGGFITVAADGNLEFESPDTSTADTTFECPVSGGLGGIIDVSDAACDTVTEVLNIINTSTSNFRCVAHAALLSESSNARWLAASDQNANRGYGVLWDTSTAFDSTLVVAPPQTTAQWIDFYFGGNNSNTLVRNPWKDKGLLESVLFSAQATSTYGSGTSTLVVYSVDVNNEASSTETVTTRWSEAAGATTVAKLFGGCDTPATACSPAWGVWGLYGGPGRKLLVRLDNSAAQASTTFILNGQQFQR